MLLAIHNKGKGLVGCVIIQSSWLSVPLNLHNMNRKCLDTLHTTDHAVGAKAK
jgi:hypothetical protein